MNRREFIQLGAVAAISPTFGCVSAESKIRRGLKELPPVLAQAEIRAAKPKAKTACYYTDDVIWLFRDLTRKRPAKAFDHPFLKGLKNVHDKYGLKVQLNLFYRTDYFYGMDEFSLADMTDAYKAEFQSASNWLKFGFHALQEFPDYPWVNADYADVAKCLKMIHDEVTRFAGDNMFARAVIPHWVPMSKDGCRALADGGIRVVYATTGVRSAYPDDPDSLPYGHAFRLLNNRKPETALFTRLSNNAAIAASICGYNHITEEQNDLTQQAFKFVWDPETKLAFREFCSRSVTCINLHTLESLTKDFAGLLGSDFIGYGNHEQYFYRDYLMYQPDYMEKVELAAKILHDAGYVFSFMEDAME